MENPSGQGCSMWPISPKTLKIARKNGAFPFTVLNEGFVSSLKKSVKDYNCNLQFFTQHFFCKVNALPDLLYHNKPLDTLRALIYIDYMSCSADTYVSLGGSNGCADQLTNWDGTQKIGLGVSPKRKAQRQAR